MLPLNLYARVRFVLCNCARDRGCSAHPVFPAPSDFRRAKLPENLAPIKRRDREGMFVFSVTSFSRTLNVIASAAKQSSFPVRPIGLLRRFAPRNDNLHRPEHRGSPAPHSPSSSPGLTGRSSIPEALKIESKGRGLLDPAFGGMTGSGATGAGSSPPRSDLPHGMGSGTENGK